VIGMTRLCRVDSDFSYIHCRDRPDIMDRRLMKHCALKERITSLTTKEL